MGARPIRITRVQKCTLVYFNKAVSTNEALGKSSPLPEKPLFILPLTPLPGAALDELLTEKILICGSFTDEQASIIRCGWKVVAEIGDTRL